MKTFSKKILTFAVRYEKMLNEMVERPPTTTTTSENNMVYKKCKLVLGEWSQDAEIKDKRDRDLFIEKNGTVTQIGDIKVRWDGCDVTVWHPRCVGTAGKQCSECGGIGIRQCEHEEHFENWREAKRYLRWMVDVVLPPLEDKPGVDQLDAELVRMGLGF